jgi:hypothetical protein
MVSGQCSVNPDGIFRSPTDYRLPTTDYCSGYRSCGSGGGCLSLLFIQFAKERPQAVTGKSLTREAREAFAERIVSLDGLCCLRLHLIFIRQVLRRLIESRFPRPAIFPAPNRPAR